MLEQKSNNVTAESCHAAEINDKSINAAAAAHCVVVGEQEANRLTQNLQDQSLLCFRHKLKTSPLIWQSVHALKRCQRCKVKIWPLCLSHAGYTR